MNMELLQFYYSRATVLSRNDTKVRALRLLILLVVADISFGLHK
jgi:hypothetical protein